jgi:hypothetical protein
MDILTGYYAHAAVSGATGVKIAIIAGPDINNCVFNKSGIEL